MQAASRRLKALGSITPDVAADPIPEFCRQHRLSVSLYYKLAPEDRPREIRIGKKVLISRESAAAWRMRMEAKALA